MRLSFLRLGLIFTLPLLGAAWPQDSAPKKPAEKSGDAADTSKVNHEAKNPVAPTPANLADAKKSFGYDCAMCHGAQGDGKGDLVESMGLRMDDWRGSAKLASLSDRDIFEMIEKGKGKMVGEGDRYAPEAVWGLVNYVRTLEKSGTGVAQKTGAPH